MLGRLDKDKETDFHKLTDHDEWQTLMDALNKRDASKLRSEPHEDRKMK